MAKQKFTVYVAAYLDDYRFGQVDVFTFDPTGAKYTEAALLATHEIELDVPEFDIREKAIVALEAEVQQERAESQSRVNLLLERISKLQAIGHEVVE